MLKRVSLRAMRGYFGIGVERISKPMNVGNLLRSAHAFGASFFFTIAPHVAVRDIARSDTSDAGQHLPIYGFDKVEDLMLPRGCTLVGVELTETAETLPSFHHPQAAAYVLGPERGSLSPELMGRCAKVIKIPTKFCVNVGIAGAIVMYDRMIAMGRFEARPLGSQSRALPLEPHRHGGVRRRSAKP